MKVIIILSVILLVIGIILERFLRRKFNITRKLNTMSQKSKWVQSIVLILLLVIYLVVILTIFTRYEDVNIGIALIPFLLLTSLFNTFMQWRYNRQANVWITEIFTGIYILMIYFIAIWLFPILLNS